MSPSGSLQSAASADVRGVLRPRAVALHAGARSALPLPAANRTTRPSAGLLQAIRRKEGFIVLAGDIGTGKTTLCRALLEQLDKTTFTSLILNPFLSVEELLREILLDFGVVSRDAVRSERLATATKHELIEHAARVPAVADRRSAAAPCSSSTRRSTCRREVLEQIRVISNLETNDSQLLQIVLVGQLNLLDVLAAADMRQLDQRISLRAMLKPLTRDEVEPYIAHRLAVARRIGCRSSSSRRRSSGSTRTRGGVPRVINLLCDRALMAGRRSRQAAIVTAELIVRGGARRLDLASGRDRAGRASLEQLRACARW